MFSRRGMLALVSALCVLASASAHAAGEFEASLRTNYFEGYLAALRQTSGDTFANRQLAEQKTKCDIDYVMQGFTSDEIARLDLWATSGQLPGDELQKRLETRLKEPRLKDVCRPPVSDQ